jgi:2-iminobutanoate/2-iminopropanoate deaminase
MTRTILALGAAAVLVGCNSSEPSEAPAVVAQQVDVQHITDDPQAPYSGAVRMGSTLFLSGKIGVSPDGENGIQPETRRAMERIKADVEANGSSMDRVVKCTVMLADMAEWGAMNEVYATFFPEGRRPARSAFGASGLARDARVEIECIAALR